MEPPSTPGRTPRHGVVHPATTTSAASPFTPGDQDSPRVRASTLAYGPRTRLPQTPVSPPPSQRAPSAPKSAPKTPQLQQTSTLELPVQLAPTPTPATPASSGMIATAHSSSNSSSHSANALSAGGTPIEWPANSAAVPRTPVRASSAHRAHPASAHSQRQSSASHSRTPSSSASYDRQRALALDTTANTYSMHMPTSNNNANVMASYTAGAGAGSGSVSGSGVAAPAAAAPGTPGPSTGGPSTAVPGTPGPAMVPGPVAASINGTPGGTAASAQPHTPGSGGGSSSHSHRKPQKRTSIGPWDFVKSIGAGSMGQVKLAVNRYTKQMAAVKIVPKAFTHKSKDSRETNEAKDARVIREAAIGRLLDHPNISRLFDVYSMTGHFYLVFEYIAGGQMLDYIISHGCVKEDQARKFARSISSALDYCHHNSVVHRDLKIENILIADDGDIRLIDFGLSNLFRRDDLLRTFCGSLYFAAPELLNAMPYVGPEIDVWSFGVVLYVLVSGKVPFEDKSMTVLHAKIKRGTVDYPQWLSSLCVDLLSRMLTVNPSERATLSEVMRHPWMVKGYDGPPDSHIPRRLPLTVDSVDPQVIEDMESLGIGEASNIERSLKAILSSAEYHAALDNWYDRQELDLATNGGVSGNNNIYSSTTSSGLEAKTPDPLDSFAPEISCYFLARERLARSHAVTTTGKPVADGIPQSGASQHQQLPKQSSNVQQPLPPTPHQQISIPPPPAETTISSPEPNIKTGRTRARTLGSAYEIPKPELAMAPPVPNTGGEELPPKAYVSNIPQQAQVGLVTPMSAVRPIDLDRSRSSTSSPRNRQTNRIVSQPIPQSHLQQQQQQQQTLSLFRKLSFRRKQAGGHTRAKSTSHATSDNFDARRETPSQSNLSSMPSIESPKPVFFRGIFSVQSTSTKPLHEIRAELIRVLTQKQIEFVEVRGGFACVARKPQTQTQPGLQQQSSHHRRQSSVHQPLTQPQSQHSSSSSSSMQRINSIGSGNSSGGVVTNGTSDITSTPTSRSTYGDHLIPPPQTPPSTPRHRRMVSENGILSPAVSLGGSSESIDIEIGASDMLGESQQKLSVPVRFEIDIVRVPIVSLYGIQFKKMTGNVWQYKNLAQEILEALRI